MIALLQVILLAGAMLTGTVLGGWWGIVAIGLSWGLLGRGRVRPWLLAAAAAAAAWGGLLGVRAMSSPVLPLDHLLAGLLHLPQFVPLGLTLAYGALLGGSAAQLGQGLRGVRDVHA